MTIDNMAFTPATGLKDNTYAPTKPLNEASLRAAVQGISDQLRDYINNELLVNLPIDYAQIADVLVKNNATLFTPTGQYNPATKKYVDDVVAGIVLGQIPDSSLTDLKLSNAPGQIKDVVNTHLADYVRNPAFGQTTGIANTYLFASTPALPALVDGVSAYIDINVANTGASTLNWDGKGAKSIVNADGTAVSSGDLVLNGIYGVRYNASTGNFQLLGKGGVVLTGTAGVADVLPTKTFYNTDSKTKLTGTYSNIKSIQIGTTTLANENNLITQSISAVDLTKAIVKVSAYSNVSATTPGLAAVRAVITSATLLTFDRVTTYGGNISIAWEVIEFNNVKSLQSGLKTYAGGFSTQTINSVDTTKSILFVTYNNSDSVPAAYSMNMKSVITNSTTLSFTIQTGTVNLAWQVLEFY